MVFSFLDKSHSNKPPSNLEQSRSHKGAAKEWRPSFLVRWTRSNWIRRRSVYWPAALILTIFCSIGIWTTLSSIFESSKCLWCGESTLYAVATQEVKPGEKLAGTFVYEERPIALVPKGAISMSHPDFSVLETKVARSTIFRGQVIGDVHILEEVFIDISPGAKSLGGGVVQEGGGRRALVAIPIDGSNHPPLKPGDRASLVATNPSKDSESETTSRIIVGNVEVFSVEERSISVILNFEDVEPVVSAIVSSFITLVRLS